MPNRPKPFPKLPPETAEQRKALAAIGPAQIEQARAWVDSMKLPGDATDQQGRKLRCSVATLRAMLNAEDAA